MERDKIIENRLSGPRYRCGYYYSRDGRCKCPGPGIPSKMSVGDHGVWFCNQPATKSLKEFTCSEANIYFGTITPQENNNRGLRAVIAKILHR